MFRTLTNLVVALALLLAVAGCSTEAADPAPPTEAPKTSTPAMPKVEAGDATVTAQLVAADAVDGTTDKVVSKCAGCKLGMNGKAEHALDVEGYSLHFCSGDCRDGFAEDATANVLAMKIPAK